MCSKFEVDYEGTRIRLLTNGRAETDEKIEASISPSTWFKHILFHNQRTALRLYQLLLLQLLRAAGINLKSEIPRGSIFTNLKDSWWEFDFARSTIRQNFRFVTFTKSKPHDTSSFYVRYPWEISISFGHFARSQGVDMNFDATST